MGEVAELFRDIVIKGEGGAHSGIMMPVPIDVKMRPGRSLGAGLFRRRGRWNMAPVDLSPALVARATRLGCDWEILLARRQ